MYRLILKRWLAGLLTVEQVELLVKTGYIDSTQAKEIINSVN